MAPLHNFNFSKVVCTVGDMRMVWNGTAKHTAGGLTKEHLMKNKRGKIVSKKRHAIAKKRWPNGPPGGLDLKKRKSPGKKSRKPTRKSPKRSKSAKRSKSPKKVKAKQSAAWNKKRDQKGSWHLSPGHQRQKIVVNGKIRWVTRRSSGKNRGSFEKNVDPRRSIQRDLATHAKKLNKGGNGGRADSRYVRKPKKSGRKSKK